MLISITSGMTITAQAATGSQIVETARKYIGKPYVTPGSNPPYSFDCSSFVWYVFKQHGITLSRSSMDYWNNADSFGYVVANNSVDKAEPGDVVSWPKSDGNISYNHGHVAIYTGNGMCIEALNPTEGVCEKYKVVTHRKGQSFKVIRINGVAPVDIGDISFTEITPYKAAFSITISNPNRVGIQKTKTRIRKVGESSWKKYKETTYSPAKNCGLKSTRSFPVSEGTSYECCYGVCVNGKYYYSNIITFTTPNKISIKGAKGSSKKAKYADGNSISTASLLTVNVGGKKLTAGTDYTVNPSTVKNIGRHKVTITGKNWYKDSVTTYVTVYPKTPTLNSAKYNKATKRIHLKWDRVKVCDYHVVAISTSPNFESSKTYAFKVSQSTQSCSIYNVKFGNTKTHIQKGKTYYVKMRAYKTVDGTKINGEWGKTKKVKCQ